ncbi:hypothetical protein EVAR_102056_1 [Eumeta japonica]|uniref:YqaJ viral recombinase domain-containing protein n=1 Tax=Eumeta variegata TaxID=151549 RepID=A0A4C1TZZ2_EUMVA|nr:hypothetical protein EVAR_102056_1 [Eumeta japonica]
MGENIPDTPAMKWGRMLETEVRKTVGIILGKKIKKCGLMLSQEYPMITGSPDGICKDSIIAIKCPTTAKTYQNYFKNSKPTERNQLKIKNATCSTYDLPDDVLNEVGKNKPKVTGDALALEASTSTSPDIITEDVDDVLQMDFAALTVEQLIEKLKTEVIRDEQILKIFEDDFRALLLLVELLPVTYSVKSRKGKGKGKAKEKENHRKGNKRAATEETETNEPLHIHFPNKYLLRLVPEGTNLEQFVQDFRAKSSTSIQPYLVAPASQSSSQNTFINGDDWFLNVPDKGNSVTSFDLLYKIFYVSNLDYPDSPEIFIILWMSISTT